MRNTIIILLLILLNPTLYAQDITGEWNGLLKVQGMQLRLVFHIEKSGDEYTATMDSPDQGATGIPVTTVSFENPELNLAVANAGITYQGTLSKENVIDGNFNQGGQSFPLNLTREKQEKQSVVRPQEPSKPYPYTSEEVTFKNTTANLELAGTLTLPKEKSPFPAVILISGSGPQNRDEELLGHKPFLIISDHLTRKGIAVLRFDDRGTAKSTGDFKSATSADFATDVEAALQYLKTRAEIDKNKIGLVGHSEGGIIAPMVAAQSSDVAFIVLLAGTGIPGDELLLAQQQLIGKANGMSEADLQKAKAINQKAFEIVKNEGDQENVKTELTQLLNHEMENNPDFEIPGGMGKEDFIKMQVSQLATPWMHYFFKHDPAETLEKVKCPVLAINGAKDLQVPAKENLEGIQQALKKGGNKDVTIRELPNLNHLFQESETGSPNEYANIEQTFSPTALTVISDWMLQEVK